MTHNQFVLNELPPQRDVGTKAGSPYKTILVNDFNMLHVMTLLTIDVKPGVCKNNTWLCKGQAQGPAPTVVHLFSRLPFLIPLYSPL